MNRYLKFRAWHIVDKKWIDPDKILITGDGEVMIDCDDCWCTDVPVEIVEYTDFKDKHGKEIYTGDIVKGENSYDKIKGEVILGEFESAGDGQGFGCNRILGYYIDGLPEEDSTETELCKSLLDWDKLEIIGNIYENPELLEEKNDD